MTTWRSTTSRSRGSPRPCWRARSDSTKRRSGRSRRPRSVRRPGWPSAERMDFAEREAGARRRSVVFSLLFLIALAATVASVDLLAWTVWALWQRYVPIHFDHFAGAPAHDAT